MSEYRELRLSEKGKKCIICGEGENIDVHHIDGDRTNNQIRNLIPVCRYCHLGIHKARENYRHWHIQLLPWHTASSGDFDENQISEEDRSTRMLVDDLIFLEKLSSSVAKQLAEIEDNDTPFRCPDCGGEYILREEYSMNNQTSCPDCSWSGAVYKGLIEAASRGPESNTDVNESQSN